MLEIELFIGLMAGLVAGIGGFYIWYRVNRTKLQRLLSNFFELYHALRDLARDGPTVEAALRVETEFYEILVDLSQLIPIKLPGIDPVEEPAVAESDKPATP